MNQLINATIEIVEMSDKVGKFGPIKKIKAKNIETGQTNTYTVYQSKQDGSISAAWTQLQTISVGDTVNVGYVEQSGVMQDGKPFTSRIVRNFDKDLGNGRKNYVQHNPPASVQSPRTGQNLASSGARDYEKEAVGKCQYGFLEAYIRSGHSFEDAKLQVVTARKLAELVVYGTQQPEPVQKTVDPTADEPTFSDDELSSIPF